MIAGIEGIHAWTPPGAEGAAIELGRIKDDEGTPVWPRFELVRVTGPGSLGEPEDNRDRPPGAAREIIRHSERRGKSIAYEGTLKARDVFELRQAEEEFRAAFDDLEGEGRMDVSWHPLLAAFAEVPPKFFEARALTADIVDTQDTRNFERPFVVGLRASDRRYFDEESEVHSVTIVNSATTYDFT